MERVCLPIALVALALAATLAGGAARLTPELKPGTASQMFVFALP